MAWKLAGLVLLVLTLVKPLGAIPTVGAIAFTFAAILQLYLPLWRVDALGMDHDFVGLHLATWRSDLRRALTLMAVTFPPYIAGHVFFMTQGHDLISSLGLPSLAVFIPKLSWAPHLPDGLAGWVAAAGWFAELLVTHVLGVALPEETFYRGYLQPRLQSRWPPSRRVFGVAIGRAAVVASVLFALGHFLGEWNPLRLGPFIPSLIFAWQRNATGSVVGAIGYHAACNLLGEILVTQYV